MTQRNSDPDPRSSRRRALPVTITAGMPMVEIADAVPATIVGITQEYCIHQIAESDTLAVSHWRDVALGNVCPAEPLLSADVTERDRDNARASLLRELLALQQFGLTAKQAAAVTQERAR